MSLQIKLVNMPFASLEAPSMALTQLRSVVLRTFPGQVSVDVHYLNHQFGSAVGAGIYDILAGSQGGQAAGLGEWLFRQVAFPDLPDNTDEYVQRYRHQFQGRSASAFAYVLGNLRERLPGILDGLIEQHRLAEADVLGLTSMFFQNLPSIALALRLKRRNPDQIIVMGGANCESTMGIELVNNVPFLDFVFSGPGLVTFPQFIAHLLRGNRDACHSLDGVFSRRNSRSIAALPEGSTSGSPGTWRASNQLMGVKELGQELDINAPIELEYEDFLGSLHRSFPQGNRKPMVMFETSRGCWWGERAHCTFCGLNGGTMAYRAMQPEKALSLMRSLVAQYGDRCDLFQCVDNIMPKEYVAEVFAHLRVPSHIKLFYEVKADMTGPQLETIARGGVKKVQPGIEALATSTLKLMRKGTTSFGNIRFLASCMQHGIEPVWNLLIGFPGESAQVYERYAEILPSLFHLPPPTGCYPVRFDRFSPYFTQQREYGLNLAPCPWYSLSYPFPDSALMNMAYYFQDLNFEAPYAVDSARWVTPLDTLVKRWQAGWGTARPPKLEFFPTTISGYIVDTRKGGAQQRDVVSSAEIALLRDLSSPTPIDRIDSGRTPTLDRITHKHLVFCERERAMSLVVGL